MNILFFPAKPDDDDDDDDDDEDDDDGEDGDGDDDDDGDDHDDAAHHFDDEDVYEDEEAETLDSEEERVAISFAKETFKKPLPDRPLTQNDKDMVAAESTMDRVEAEVAQPHREEKGEQYSPLVAGVKEARLLETFR